MKLVFAASLVDTPLWSTFKNKDRIARNQDNVFGWDAFTELGNTYVKIVCLDLSNLYNCTLRFIYSNTICLNFSREIVFSSDYDLFKHRIKNKTDDV